MATWRSNGASYNSAGASVSASGTLTVPGGVVVGDAVLLVVVWGAAAAGETPPSVTPSGGGWTTLVAPRTDDLVGWAVFTKAGLAPGNTFTVALSASRQLLCTHNYFQAAAGFDVAHRGPVTARSASAADCSAAATTTTQPSELVVVVSVERSATGGTAIVSDGVATARHFIEGTGGTAVTSYVGDFTGPVAPGTTSPITIAYSHASAAGAAVQFALPSPTPVSPAVETNAARPVTRVRGLRPTGAVETGSAQPATATKIGHVGQAAAVDVARPGTGRKVRTVGAAAATDIARPAVGTKRRAVAPALEADVPSIAVPVRWRSVAPAVEVAAASVVGRVKRGLVGRATAVETARPAFRLRGVGGLAAGYVVPQLVVGPPVRRYAAVLSQEAAMRPVGAARLVLPAGTSEALEVPLHRWPAGLSPGEVEWRASVSNIHDVWPGPAPAGSDDSWTVTVAVDRGTAAEPDVRVLVPVDGLAAGRYGVWVRVAGPALQAPARWCGQLVLT